MRPSKADPVSRTARPAALVVLLCICSPPTLGAQTGTTEVTPLRFRARDGVELHGELYRADAAAGAPVVLLFHQGAGSAAEYGSIAPRLARSGYHVVTVDQRRGGDLFGGANRTVIGLGDAPPANYCDVYPDMEATLTAARANGAGGPVIAWGSSYSAALALRLALEHPEEVAAVAAFSPASGEPMAGCEPERLAEQLRQPLFVARPDRELDNTELPWIAEQFDHFAALGAVTFVSSGGRHASSMLVPGRNAEPTEPAWRALGDFLFGNVPAPGRRVVLDNDGWKLVGELTVPLTEGLYPAALLLHNAAGSRDEQRTLAAELARRGIASLRIDLRGHGDSVNRGRFDPEDLDGTRHLIVQAGADVQRALAALPTLAAVDPQRVAVVGASYSGEAMAEAARSMGRYQAAYVALSPGNFSVASIAAIDRSGAPWLMMRSEIERPFFDDLFEDIASGSGAEIEIVPGSAHGTDILTDPGPASLVADWIEAYIASDAR